MLKFILFFLLISINLYPYEEFKLAFKNNDYKEINKYLTFYGLNFKDVKHKFYFIYYKDTNQCFVHEMTPTNPKGIIFFFHGFLSHSGLFKDFYKYFLNLNYKIITVDLPGHGLSDGKRTSIDDFSTYADMVYWTYFQMQKEGLGLPIYFIGHSTGCAAILEFIYSYKIYPEKIIFVAPLVRIIFWELATFGYQLFGNNITTIPRLRRQTSQDKEYIEFIFNKDPIKYEEVYLDWFTATLKWNERIVEYKPNDRTKLLIVQGDNDTVVEWKYNINFLTNLFIDNEVTIIKNGRHDLLTEIDNIKTEAFERIKKFLKN